MSKQSFGTLFGDILTEWLLRHVEDVFLCLILKILLRILFLVYPKIN